MGYYFSYVILGMALRQELSKTNEVPGDREIIVKEKPAVRLTGAAEPGRIGRPDPVVIDGDEFAYYFEVDLPCIWKDLSDFDCDVGFDGKVHVYGIVQSGEISKKWSPIVCPKKRRRISPPSPFSISFSLPDRVDANYSIADMTNAGKLRGYVLRAGLPPVCRHYFHHSQQFA